MIHFQDVTKYYANGYLALNRVNFRIHPGEFVFLTGHSGAGKSTLLKLISAREIPTKGSITVANQNISQLKSKQIPYLRRRIGIISQTPNLLADRTVFDNIALPLIISEKPFSIIASAIQAVLEKVGLQQKAHFYPHELSSGEQQRVSIARAIINNPSILIADEPTATLDPTLAEEIIALFEQFHASGMTVLIASHDLALIQRKSYRIITLSKGKLFDGPV